MKALNRKCIVGCIFFLMFILIFSNTLQFNIIDLFLAMIIVVVLSYILIKNDDYILISILASSLTLTFLIENVGVSGYIRYLLDYFLIIALCKNIYYFAKGKAKFLKIYIIMIIFGIFTAISAIVNKSSVFRYLYSFYSDYFRYFIVFMSVANFKLKKNFVETYMKKLYLILLMQVPIVIIQYFYYEKYWVSKGEGDIKQDYISGILGGRGTAEIGMIACLAVSFVYVLYQRKKIKLSTFIITTIGMILILSIGEIKFCLILLVLMLFIMIILRLNIKGIITLLLVLLMCYFGMNELQRLYGWEDILTKEAIEENLDYNYAGSNLSRMSAFRIANEQIKETGANMLFGRGIGNVKVKGTIIGKRTEFQSNNIYEFKQFTISQYLAENGWLGFISLILIFIYLIYVSFELMRRVNTEQEKIIGNCGIPLIIIILISTFYSTCMTKISFAILAWFLMGILERTYLQYKEE